MRGKTFSARKELFVARDRNYVDTTRVISTELTFPRFFARQLTSFGTTILNSSEKCISPPLPEVLSIIERDTSTKKWHKKSRPPDAIGAAAGPGYPARPRPTRSSRAGGGGEKKAWVNMYGGGKRATASALDPPPLRLASAFFDDLSKFPPPSPPLRVFLLSSRRFIGL